MSLKYLVVEKLDDAVFSVQLSRGGANAVDRDMYIELEALFADIDAYCPDARCIVLAGAGRSAAPEVLRVQVGPARPTADVLQ
mgnify:CR=1 FL=1